MSSFFRNVKTDFKNRKSIELYLILAVAIAVLVADVFGVVSQDALFEIVLAALALLIYGLIEARRTSERLKSSLQEISDNLTESKRQLEELPHRIYGASKSSILLKFEDRPELAEIAKKASTIDILALSASYLFAYYDGFLYKKIEEGCNIRLLILDPESDAARVVHENSRNKEIIVDIKKTINRCFNFTEKFSGRKINFELKVTKWLPPNSLIMVDGHKPSGVISLGVFPVYLKTPQTERRILFFEAKGNSQEHFLFYRNQFEGLWSDNESTRKVDFEK